MLELENALEPLLNWERLLRPIPGNNPSGQPIRHEPVYDEIRRALAPRDTAPRGSWLIDEKPVDLLAIIRSASDVLAGQSKDLNVAVWLTEALLRCHRMPGLSEGLHLIRSLLESFWDTVYPPIDNDGDEGFRARPINRLNTCCIAEFALWPIANNDFTLQDEAASRSESAARSEDNSRPERGPKLEDINRAIDATPRRFYERHIGEILQAREEVTRVETVCEQLFKTADRPRLGKLLAQMETLRVTINRFLEKKGPPPKVTALQIPIAAPVVSASAEARTEPSAELETPSGAPASGSIHEIAATLRRADPSNPVPYMLIRSWQFGRLFANGNPPDEVLLEPPSTTLKKALRRAIRDEDWWSVLEQTEEAMELACGACWLDLQRYSFMACRELGHPGAAAAIRGLLAGLLQAIPDLPMAAMLDGSPTASPDTARWLRDEVLGGVPRARDTARRGTEPEADPEPPDAFKIAETETRAGHFGDAIRVLKEALTQESCGRGRIQRKLQLARISMAAGHHRMALPILREIDQVIQDRRLEDWEPPEWIASHLENLYRCLESLGEDADDKKRIYDRLCALDPLKALELMPR